MKIVEFLSYLRGLDVQVVVDGDRLRCNAPEGALTPALRIELAERKAEIISFLRQANVNTGSTAISLLPASRKTVPLSFAQQRLWFLEQLVPGNPFYNVPTAVRLSGPLNITALEQTFNEIVRRHEALRTSFQMVEGQLVQVLAPHLNVPLPVVDLEQLPTTAREQAVRQLTAQAAQRPFALAIGPLLRVQLLRLGVDEHVLLLTMHHIVSDGWSIGVLLRELGVLYTAFATGQPSPLAELPLQYADFAQWQRQWLQGEVSTQLAYWRQQLDNLPVLELPTDRARPPVQSYRGATQYLSLSLELTQALESVSQSAGVTLFITLLAAFQTLLYRYSGQTDIPIGSPIANRNRSEIEGLIGFFVNSLVLRTDLSGNPTFQELLERVREVALGAYAHQDLPFEKLVEELQPERDLNRNPLFQVVFALQNAPLEALTLPGLTLSPLDIDPGTTRFDLEFHLSAHSGSLGSLGSEPSNQLEVLAVYNTDLFDSATITRMLAHFETLLEGIVANSGQRLADLPLLSEGDRHQMLVQWNNTQAEYPKHLCIHQLFEAQVEQTPEAVAVRFVDQQFTYQELNNHSNQLAHYLKTLGVGPDVLVGICMERSWEMMVGLLGILKAGGAYVPLDPTYPQERLNWMLADSQVSLLLTQQRLAHLRLQVPQICLDMDLDTITQQNQANPVSGVTAAHLVYIIYTSGSTGKPKGVPVEHGNLLNLVSWHQKAFEVLPTTRATQIAGAAFDACGWEIWPYLTAGASIHFPDEETRTSPTQLRDWLLAQGITISFLPTPLAERVLALDWPKDKALRTLLTGGDNLQQSPPTSLPFAVVNNYGPTENTVVTTSGLVTAGPAGVPTIGRPIANTQVYLLDARLQPVPIGARGELYVSGDGLARGYLNRPELTAERFIPHPFSLKPGARLYKTGDLARYRPDGSLEFLGRIDEQVKIRGFRIELGEIEALLAQHPAVRETVVIAHEQLSGDSGAELGKPPLRIQDRRLVAYVTPNIQYSSSQEQMQQMQLPDEQVLQWQMLYEETYSQPAPHADPTFNIVGWNSSYTGQPLPAEQIREWVDDRVERILTLQPQRVLEIGCGTGLLLFRLAPHCTEYWGTDFSQVSLDYIRQQLVNQELPQVTLLQKMATDFKGVEAEAFDAVILNSVVQYFPSIDYLLQVIEGAVEAIAQGGFIFLGDVRSLPLLQTFHASVQLYQAEASLSKEQLQQRVQTQMFEETELVIDPAFFTALKQRFPKIGRVQIQLPRGRHHNEMTQFRYNVILHIESISLVPGGHKAPPLPTHSWLDWSKDKLTVSAVRQQLVETQPEILGITQIPNARVMSALKAAQWLSSTEEPRTVGQFREVLPELSSGVDPEDWTLDEELPYTLDISWSASGGGEKYDVVYTRHQSLWETGALLPIANQNNPLRPWHNYANNPLQAKFACKLVPQLRMYLAEKLPDYMVPSSFIVLEALPLTPNGKVNRRALRAPDPVKPQLEGTDTLPRSVVEEVLVGIWSEVLGLKRVGIHDNFFELGGHSLLATQLISRVRDAFQIELPLRSLFEQATIAGLSKEVERFQNSNSRLQAPAILPVSREARRVKLSSLNKESKE